MVTAYDTLHKLIHNYRVTIIQSCVFSDYCGSEYDVVGMVSLTLSRAKHCTYSVWQPRW